VHHLLGEAYLASGKAELAKGALRAALDLVPASAPVQFRLAQALTRGAQSKEALELLQKVAEHAPDMPNLRLELASTLVRLGRQRRRRANPRRRWRPTRGTYDPTTSSGRRTPRWSNTTRRSTCFRAAIQADPNSLEARRHLIQSLLRRQQREAATQAAREALALNPKSAPVHSLLGAAYLGKKDPAQAENAFRAAVEADPKYVPARLGLAQLGLGQKKLDKSERQARLPDEAAQRDEALRLAQEAVSASLRNGSFVDTWDGCIVSGEIRRRRSSNFGWPWSCFLTKRWLNTTSA